MAEAEGAPGKGAASASMMEAASVPRMTANGAESFRDVWSAKIWPVIQKVYEKLLKLPPLRVQERSAKKWQQTKKKGKKIGFLLLF